MSELRLYDTLSRRKQPLVPLEPPFVRVYSCGPTVYARQHLGNLRTYVFADLLNRSLRFFGFEAMARQLQGELSEVRSLLYPK